MPAANKEPLINKTTENITTEKPKTDIVFGLMFNLNRTETTGRNPRRIKRSIIALRVRMLNT